jgi:zinc transporter
LNRHEPGTRNWINSQSGLDSITCEALLAEETRPRCLTTPDPGSDPEDMVSIRAWADANRVITLRGQRLLAIQDIRDRLSAGPGFATPGDLLATLAARLIDRMGPVVDALQDEFDGLEEDLLGAEEKEARPRLSAIRRQAVALRRYLSPQRDVLSRLSTETLPWLTEANRARFRETADRVTRYVEDLDATRERASVTQEELTARLQDRMNRNMYILSLVAAVFLPLGLITGLLGINVGGIPGTDSPGAFIVVCVILGVIGILELLLFYFRRWL